MFFQVSQRLNVRAIIVCALAAVMLLSLLCSLSIQSGHADVPIAPSAGETRPLTVGQAAPRFVVSRVDGTLFNFDPTSLERPALIVTFRGGWCPYCNMHLSELRTVMPAIDALGVDILFLSGDRAEILHSSLRADAQGAVTELDYQLYSDADAQAAVAFGIAFRAADTLIARRNAKGDDIEQSSMQRHGVLAVPSVFAIDTDGMIRFAFVEPDYKVRLPADDLLVAARQLVQ